MIKEITRNILGGIYSYANNTIMYSTNPFLLPNNEVTLFFTDNDSKFNTTVASVNANNIILSTTNLKGYDGLGVVVQTPCFNAGTTGIPLDISLYTSTTPRTILQATVYGSGAANVNIKVSSDKRGWIDVANIAANSTVNTSYYNSSDPWPYARLNFVSIDANTTVTVTRAS